MVAAPAAATSSGDAYSSGLWLMPPRQRTKSIAICAGSRAPRPRAGGSSQLGVRVGCIGVAAGGPGMRCVVRRSTAVMNPMKPPNVQ